MSKEPKGFWSACTEPAGFSSTSPEPAGFSNTATSRKPAGFSGTNTATAGFSSTGFPQYAGKSPQQDDATLDADVSPLVCSLPSDAVLEVDSEPEIDSEAELDNTSSIVRDTECITNIINSDCSTQNSVTNNASSIQNVSFDTNGCENLSEAQNCGSEHDYVLNSTLPLETLSDHNPANLSQENWFKKKSLNVMYINIHYLYSKLDELKILLSKQTNIDVLCIFETFLNDTFSDSEIQLENYQLFREKRKKNGGGLVIYVKECLQCSLRDDLQTEGIEALWVEIKQEALKAFLLGYTYRSPSAQQKWMNDFESVLEQVYTEDK